MLRTQRSTERNLSALRCPHSLPFSPITGESPVVVSGKYVNWQCVLMGILAVRAENVNSPSTSEIANIGMSDFLYLRLAERERSRLYHARVTLPSSDTGRPDTAPSATIPGLQITESYRQSGQFTCRARYTPLRHMNHTCPHCPPRDSPLPTVARNCGSPQAEGKSRRPRQSTRALCS